MPPSPQGTRVVQCCVVCVCPPVPPAGALVARARSRGFLRARQCTSARALREACVAMQRARVDVEQLGFSLQLDAAHFPDFVSDPSTSRISFRLLHVYPSCPYSVS